MTNSAYVHSTVSNSVAFIYKTGLACMRFYCSEPYQRKTGSSLFTLSLNKTWLPESKMAAVIDAVIHRGYLRACENDM